MFFTVLFILGWNSLADGNPGHFSSDSCHNFHTKNPLLYPIQVSYLLFIFCDLDISSQTRCFKQEMFCITQKICFVFGFPTVLLNVNDFDSTLQFFLTLLEGRAENISQLTPPLVMTVSRGFLHSLCIRSLDHLFFSSVVSFVLKAELWGCYLHRK